MNRTFDVAVFDAGNLSGETLVRLLDERVFPVGSLYPLAGNPGPDSTVEFRGEELELVNISGFNFADTDLLFLPAGSEPERSWVDAAVESGCMVIDASRNPGAGSVILPAVNPELVQDAFEKKYAVVPSSPAALMLPVLKPLQDAVGIDIVSVTACQAVSGSGSEGITELRGQTLSLLSGKPVSSEFYSQRVAFNMLPEVGNIQEDGFSSEETAIIQELMAVLDTDDIRVNPTCVRVPVFYGDSLAVHLEMDRPLNVADARELLSGVDGLVLAAAGEIPTVETLADNDDMVIGRIRQNPACPEQLSLWLVADAVKRGSISSLELAEILLKDFLK